jgi:hypothetical protein
MEFGNYNIKFANFKIIKIFKQKWINSVYKRIDLTVI